MAVENETIRLARLDDVPAIMGLIEASVRELQAEDYTPEQREGALGAVFGVDRQLIRDGTYYVAEVDGELVGCGGWSRRKTLFGADAAAQRDDSALVPGVDPARIRAFFISPRYARRGLGTRLLAGCEGAAREFGFTELQLGATLTGLKLYARYGYVPGVTETVPLPNGAALDIVHMHKSFDMA
ncbi:GNAT family N-acetyltransferase [Robbsia sp. Bb-Pol-6]|uniref:GNAT family N-acetyltransferase n=1 Tax=Robbsia betulipollinis TaxID=2981849 RepID=A0ABT3ZJX7_9BURK|nr:GNAT family N-acetyltransferase [Robbsia betulipollinis]MCY0386834.1 GNAT family N-acetyltransferase [Robbsia betulipollinis]